MSFTHDGYERTHTDVISNYPREWSSTARYSCVIPILYYIGIRSDTDITTIIIVIIVAAAAAAAAAVVVVVVNVPRGKRG